MEQFCILEQSGEGELFHEGVLDGEEAEEEEVAEECGQVWKYISLIYFNLESLLACCLVRCACICE